MEFVINSNLQYCPHCLFTSDNLIEINKHLNKAQHLKNVNNKPKEILNLDEVEHLNNFIDRDTDKKINVYNVIYKELYDFRRGEKARERYVAYSLEKIKIPYEPYERQEINGKIVKGPDYKKTGGRG